ncbi:MAG: hypothetical protein LRS41_07090 [Caldisphaeraceae archaeon]|nr:hypothetical protein [Caldisphaeraceae archaeon]
MSELGSRDQLPSWVPVTGKSWKDYLLGIILIIRRWTCSGWSTLPKKAT